MCLLVSAGGNCFGSFGNQRYGGRFGVLVRLAFGFDVAQFAGAGLYGQGHFHSHILGRQVRADPAQRRPDRGGVVGVPQVHRAPTVQGGGGDHHPQREIVVRDPQLQRPFEQARHHRVQGQVVAELVARAKGPFVVDEDPDQLLHGRFWVLVQGRESFPDLFQVGEAEFVTGAVPELVRDGGAVEVGCH